MTFKRLVTERLRSEGTLKVTQSHPCHGLRVPQQLRLPEAHPWPWIPARIGPGLHTHHKYDAQNCLLTAI